MKLYAAVVWEKGEEETRRLFVIVDEEGGVKRCCECCVEAVPEDC